MRPRVQPEVVAPRKLLSAHFAHIGAVAGVSSLQVRFFQTDANEATMDYFSHQMDLHRRMFVEDHVALRAFDSARLVPVALRFRRVFSSRLLDDDMLRPLGFSETDFICVVQMNLQDPRSRR